MRAIVAFGAVFLATLAIAGDSPRPAPAGGKPKLAPEIRIGQPPAPGCESKSASREKTLDGRQVAALVAVQRHLIDEGFQHFARGLTSECFRSLDGYVFQVIPGTVVGVVVIESGACRQNDFRRADNQILYEWSGLAPLKLVFGEPGAARAAALSRAAIAESASCPDGR